MQINKTSKTKQQSSNTLFDDDFASGFEESKLDKFKPLLKALAVVILLVGAVWGAVAYFNSTDTKNSIDKDYAPNTAVQQGDDSDSKLSQCITDANSKNPTPDTTDPNFYPKLISGYDAQLACYDQYPDAHGANSRSSIELARDNALDSSGNYKNTYTPPTNSSQQSSGSSTTPKPYDPSKCEPLNAEATRLRQVEAQKKTAYDNTFDKYSKISYGDIYDDMVKKYGNPTIAKIEADRINDAHYAELDQLLADWKSAGDTSNAAYKKYQECRATL